MLFPSAIEFLTTLKNASTDEETSDFSIPVFSAIAAITSALVTFLKFIVKLIPIPNKNWVANITCSFLIKKK